MMEPYIKEFIEAVYPEYTELALASFNEKECLTEATRIIRTLRELLKGTEYSVGAVDFVQEKANDYYKSEEKYYCAECHYEKGEGHRSSNCGVELAQALLVLIREANGVP